MFPTPFLKASFLIFLTALVPTFLEFKPALADQGLVFGSTLTLTGPGASWGKNARQGMELAKEEINATGGIRGRPLKIIYDDFGNFDLKRALSAARKFISIDRVSVLLPMIVEDGEVIAPIAAQQGILTFSVGVGARNFSRFSNLAFRGTSSDDALVEKLIETALKLERSNHCIVATEIRYHQEYADYIENLLRKQTGKMPYRLNLPLTESNFSTVAGKLKAHGCDSIFTWVVVAAQGPLTREIRRARIEAQVYGTPVTDTPEVLSGLGHTGEGVIFAKYLSGTSDFVQRYVNRWGEEPLRPAAPAYDSIKVLSLAMGVGGNNSAAVATELLKVKNYEGASGSFTIHENRERSGEIVELKMIKNGKVVAFEPLY